MGFGRFFSPLSVSLYISVRVFSLSLNSPMFNDVMVIPTIFIIIIIKDKVGSRQLRLARLAGSSGSIYRVA